MTARKLAPAVLFGLLIVGVAPFMGRLAPTLRSILSDGYVRWLSVGFGAALLVLVAWAVSRIRDRHFVRYSLLVLALGLASLQIFIFNRDSPAEDAVERAHFLFYGVLAVLLYRASRSEKDPAAIAVPLIAAAIVGTLDEWLQWLVPLRVGELADVALNVYAGLCGLIVGVAVLPMSGFRWRLSSASTARLCFAVALFLVVFGGFVHSAHLGYRHFDPAIGWFDSYFRIDRLPSVDEDRTRRWATDPPGPFRVLEIEDYFRTEAGWRVNHRNAALGRGDTFQAGKENLILETYFAAFLDRGRAGPHGYRLPAGQLRALARSQSDVDPYVYRSPADLDRVHHRPMRSSWWTVIGLFTAIAALVPVIVLAGVRGRAQS